MVGVLPQFDVGSALNTCEEYFDGEDVGCGYRVERGRLGCIDRQIGKLVEEAGRIIGKLKVRRHEDLRTWILEVSCLVIFLVHYSKGLTKDDVEKLMGK